MKNAQYQEKMEQARFLPITDDLFRLYDEYEKYCQENQNYNGILWLYFYRGETFFRMGRYQDAQELLNRCILEHNESVKPELMENCYNILGLIYYAMGYEFLSMQNYLQAIKIAEENFDYRKKIIVQINMGWLFRDLGDYEKALSYYKQNLEDIKKIQGKLDYNLEELCQCYIAQIYFNTGKNEEGISILKQVEERNLHKNDIFYEASKQNMLIRGYYYLQDQNKLQKNIDLVIENAANEDDFLEFSESYLDICEFLIQVDQHAAERLIRVMRGNCNKLDLAFLNLKMKRLELEYSKKYLDRNAYLIECGEYVAIRNSFEKYDKLSKAANMAIVEKLDKMRAEKERYQEKSRHDLQTNLLNKVSFSETITDFMKDNKQLKYPFEIGMAIIDIDSFKSINDTYGHDVGDEVIVDTAKFIISSFSGEVLLGRIGGDEFSVFWTNAKDRDTILEEVQSLHDLYKQKAWHAKEGDFKVSISVGLGFTDEIVTYEKLFRKVDEALYRAKEQGKNRTVISN